MDNESSAGKLSRIAAVLVAVLFSISGCGADVEQVNAARTWIKIGADGRPLSSASGSTHRCVLDQRTGLMWEVKSEVPGLHFYGHTYSWYSTDRQSHMSDTGVPDHGQCGGSRCDTEAFVDAVNQAGLCEFRDWYLPKREELMTLGERRLIDTGLVVDPDLFGHITAGEYWTGETFRLYPQAAWAVDMQHGLDRADRKKEAKAVWLVRRHQLASAGNM